jgi:hypothetical protein
MIAANVRQTLGRDDAQLALRLIARGSAEEHERCEGLLRDRGLDALLDDPRLLPALCESRQGTVASFPLFAYVVVRHALRGAGEEDRMLADYLASLLMHFGMRGRALQISEVDDETYATLADIAGDLDGPDPRRTFLVGAHLGNYALWLSGLFPDYIESRRWRRGGPDLDYYEAMGRRGFQVAASHRMAAEHGVEGLFSAAAERFPLLRMALNSVSDSLLFPNVHSPDRLLRQVRDESRWKLMS